MVSQRALKLIAEAYDNRLIDLHLDDCGLTEVPSEIYKLKDFLKELTMNSNSLTYIPEEINCFTKLEILAVRMNEIESISDGFFSLTKLQNLDLRSNKLKILDDKMGDLTSLKALDVRYNELVTLPASIGNLISLNTLKISHNKISSIPSEMRHLRNLQQFEFQGNQLTLPEDIPEENIFEVINYFIELNLNEKTDFLYEIKMILLGEPRAGKSTIANALSNPDFVFNPKIESDSTHGINIFPWNISKEDLNIPKDFRINIWDFGGQHIYYSTHHLFLTKSTVYLLINEARRDINHDDYYEKLKLIEALSEKSPVIIVTSKCELSYASFPEKEYKKNFKNIYAFKEVSCIVENKSTIVNLQTTIKEIITNKKILPEIGIELPGVWINIRDEIEKLKDNGVYYISLNEYLTICNRYQMNRERALYLSDYYNRIGVITYYRDNIHLRNIIFLNQQWLADAVYKVLDNKLIKKNNGFFTISDLLKIWEEKEHQDKHSELLTLIKNEKFELCYELEPNKYCAPQLFNPNQVPFTWNPIENLRFEYRYKQYMPHGIFSRFIVKRHPDIFQKTHWRYGVILKYKNTKALVTENIFENPKGISIRIDGAQKRTLLHIICKSIEEINGIYKNLEVDERVACNCNICRKNIDPEFYSIKDLENFKFRFRKPKQCPKSGLNVNIDKLIDYVTFTKVSRIQQLIQEVKQMEIGIKNAYNFQNLVMVIFGELFEGILTSPQKENEIYEKAKRIDIVFDNSYMPSSGGFFNDLINKYQINCPWIFIECKNVSKDVDNQVFDQLSGRFSPHTSKFGFIVCRKIFNRQKILRHCNMVLKNKGENIIVLDDEDLIEMLNLKKEEDIEAIDFYLDKKLKEIHFI